MHHLMARTVARLQSQAHQENVAIVNISSLPGSVLDFLVVHDVLREFLDDHLVKLEG